MIASKRSAAPNVTIHHRMVPNAAASARSCCEHVGESYGESMAAVRAKHCENACLSSRTSPSSTVTSEASICAAAWNQMDCSTPRDEIKEDESMDTAWTDDRHSSYLSSMEEMFVRNMFDREYCAEDICGESASSCEQDCVESRPPSSFKVMQGGGWQPLPCRRLHSWELPSPTIFSSPWVRHFKSRAPHDEQQIPKATQSIICRTSTAYELEDDDVPEVPDVSSTWVRRINSRSSATSSSNASSRVKNKNTGVFDTGRCSSSKKYKAASSYQLNHQVTSVDQVVPRRVKIEELGAICKSEQDESQHCNSSSRIWTSPFQQQ